MDKMKLIFDYDENVTGHVPDETTSLDLPKHLMRSDLPLPNVNEVDVVRHYTDLSRKILDRSWYLPTWVLHYEVQS
uniref:Uncharacterized protein n=1 Tax=uncultured marine thaumarchaeote KM3_197_F10 TaxID=1456088 RepID=A0A075GXI4_9ARCH|nr:hypothetical protein [uncultured marine thaumarchaeote KM3_197_F10]